MSNSLPQPFSVRPSGDFEGNDGSWSTFLISIGTDPVQHFRTLISTSSFSTWLPTPDGCVYTAEPAFVPSNCPELRGIGLLNGFQSSGFEEANGTFRYIGIHSLDLGNDLSTTESFGSTYNITGNLGLDTLSVQNGAGSDDLKTQGSVPIFGINNWNFFMPSLGLGVGYLQSTTQETASLVETLVNSSQIPSRAWSYTAGASYRDYTGSLVLGGYDDTRLDGRTTTQYALPPSTETTELRVSLASIGFAFANGTEASIPVSETVVIDSTLPYMYLPSTVCDELAAKLGLTYNEPADLFTISPSSLAANEQSIQQIRITVGDTKNSGNTTSITFPYAAFALNASWPLFDQGVSQPFFPIRRAEGNTYILGRAFLQEAHLSVDWERAYFNLSQAAFPETRTAPNLVPIYNTSIVEKSGTALPVTTRSSSSGLGSGAIAGLVIGIILAVALLVGLFLYLCIFRKRRQQQQQHDAAQTSISPSSNTSMVQHRKEEDLPSSPTDTFSSYDPISPIDGSFLHIRRVSEMGTESADDTRRGVNVFPGIYEVADTPRRVSEMDGFTDEKAGVRVGEEEVEKGVRSPSSQAHSSPRSEMEG